MTLPHEITRQDLAGLHTGLWHEEINLGDFIQQRYRPGRTSTFVDAERRTLRHQMERFGRRILGSNTSLMTPNDHQQKWSRRLVRGSAGGSESVLMAAEARCG
jgi:hypothetical protein